MRLLTKEEIIFLNKNNVSKFGGNYVPPNNLLNENPLDYLVEIVGAALFGEPIYPEFYHKAGVYLYNIISNHIFTDGNKRTGLDACFVFLEINGYRLNENVSDNVLTDFIISIASGEQTLEAVQIWIKTNWLNK